MFFLETFIINGWFSLSWSNLTNRIFRKMLHIFKYSQACIKTTQGILEKWSLNTGGLLTQTLLLKALVTSKADSLYACNMLIFFFFHENITVLKIESREVEETIKTIIYTHFIIKFKIPVHWSKVYFHIKYKSEEKVVSEIQNLDAKKWSWVFEDRWSLNAGWEDLKVAS